MTSTKEPKLERTHRKIYEKHEIRVSREDDLLWREIVAHRSYPVPCSLPHGKESSGLGQGHRRSGRRSWFGYGQRLLPRPTGRTTPLLSSQRGMIADRLLCSSIAGIMRSSRKFRRFRSQQADLWRSISPTLASSVDSKPDLQTTLAPSNFFDRMRCEYQA